MKIPSHIKASIRNLGLRTQEETLQVLVADNLEVASKRAAETAEYHGNRGQWWRLWIDIQEVLGIEVESALASLGSSSLRWLGQWAAKENNPQIAIAALLRYHGSHEADTGLSSDISTLAELLLDQGDYQRLAFICDRIKAAGETSPSTEAYAILAYRENVGLQLATDALNSALQRFPHGSALWLVKAVLDSSELDRCLENCVKSGFLVSNGLLKYTRSVIPELNERLEKMKSSFGQVWRDSDCEDKKDEWCSARGARLRLTDQDSPHWFGGDYFSMPKCVGCGANVTQVFVIETSNEPELAGTFSSWPKLPIFSCLNCSMHLGRNDFEVNCLDEAIKWIAHELNPKQFGISHASSIATQQLPKAKVSLDWLPPVSSRSDIPRGEMSGDQPQIGGKPDWVQYPERIYCPKCWQEMAFYGALGSTYAFKPVPIIVNNESGYLYHFACNDCHLISIISQCT